MILEHIKKPMAGELLFGKLKNGGIVKIDTDPSDKDKLKFDYFTEQPKASPPPAKRPERV
jgi:ATP-dependent Clp protease ATP-binding subunit ClpA